MRFSYTEVLIRQTMQRHNTNTKLTDKSFEAYEKEHNRLGALKDDAENIWEERTYQIAAGGLSLTFAVFSFLMGRDNGISFSWQMLVIWAVFAVCLVMNYLSQRVSVRHFEKMQKVLFEDRENNTPYNEKVMIERCQKSDRLINCINFITELLLIANIVFTIVYICVLFNK